MPTPSTFASAAAGNNLNQPTTRDAANEWSRRANGATQTFRRQSGATTISSNPSASALPQLDHPPRYIPPYRNGALPEASNRYDREQMLELYTMHAEAGALNGGLQDLLLSGLQQDMVNGASAGWTRADSRDSQLGLEACWDKSGAVEPLGLREMDDEERELFATSVNTPIKMPATNKDTAQANGLPGRKTSVSNIATTPGGFAAASPSVARGSIRRRDTSESFPFPQNSIASPGGFARDEPRAASPPPALLRRRTDQKDLRQSEDSADEANRALSTFGTVRRNPAVPPLSAGFAAPTSPWSTNGPQSAGMSPMGAFGNFALSQQSGGEKRPGLGSGRSESRFKNLLNKDSNEDIGQRPPERKASISSLARVNENESWRAQHQASDLLEDPDEDLPSGSAALAADADVSPPQPRQGFRGFGTPSKHSLQDEYGFGAFGMTSDNTHGFGQGFLPGRDAFQQTPAQNRGAQPDGPDLPTSPTHTNPYQSPEHHNIDRMAQETGDDGHDSQNTHLPGLGSYGVDGHHLGGLGSLGALPHLGRNPGAQGPASDRSQTSSAGPNRGFPSLGGLGQLGNVTGSSAWPVSQGGLGTPSRQTSGLNNPFGAGVFANAMGDLQSPSLAGLGGAGMMGQHGSQFGGSRMASMFPQGMQDQLRQSDHERDPSSDHHSTAFSGLGDVGRPGESPFTNQGFGQTQDAKSQQELTEGPQGQFAPPGQQAPPQSGHPDQQAQSANPAPGSSAHSQPPAPQQRTMVMPDRMRWIYRDPQGQTQGPWTGLEMHDWYKAGFFSPELLVKKYEDPDYEPLAQLIRRIGNSREPFLVPQIGIPHGAPTAAGPNTWAGSGSVAAPAGGTQPPFASSFPSFGTTLTAEQQNALERRKQEEQYLMARQKEHLAQAQIAQRMQLQGGHAGLMPGQLHHHSSAHSLQSQPSFGSMTSPTGYQPSPVQGPTAGIPQASTQGFYDGAFRSPQPSAGLGAVGTDPLARIREEEMPGIIDRLNLGDNRTGAGQYGAPGQRQGGVQQSSSSQDAHEERYQQMLQDRARLQLEQAEHDAQQHADEQQQQMANDRLQQFHQLQAQNEAHFQHDMTVHGQQPGGIATQESSATQSSVGSPELTAYDQRAKPEPLSLTEQVQKAASAKQSPAPQQAGFPQPFPPAPSQSPLPAPAAQRTGRQSVADQLQTGSRDHSQTPSTETPSAAVAPWAKEPAEAARGPSLKEIQEAEAKKAAEVEELAAAARRAAFQKEMEAQVQAATIAPGLPTSSTWGAGSPATPTGTTPAAWAKSASKPTGATSSKTLAQIQKEEEARKRRAVAAAAASQQQAAVMSGIAVTASGKSYANLAGKVTSAAPNANVGGAWTTVGAGGKPKTPGGAPLPVSRTVSNSVVPTVQVPNARKAPVRSNTMANPGGINALDEFKKWALNELRPDLNKGINAEEFVAGLLNFPPEPEILTEAVHGVSSTIDSRHFAEEWIRRKRLADKGLVDSTVPKSGSPAQTGDKNAGGWSQVAKKGPVKEEPKEEANGNFRVVPSKKKGGKR